MVVRSFEEIETQRERLGVIQRDLCQRADVYEGTYSKAKQTGKEPTPRIRRKLWTALDALIAERKRNLIEAEKEMQT